MSINTKNIGYVAFRETLLQQAKAFASRSERTMASGALLLPSSRTVKEEKKLHYAKRYLRFMFLTLSLFVPTWAIAAGNTPVSDEKNCDERCDQQKICLSERCVSVYEQATYLEKRFIITQPAELGEAADSVLDTVERLGIDLKLAAMTFGEANDESWSLEYGAATGNGRGKYTYQQEQRNHLQMYPSKIGDRSWTTSPFVYSLDAYITFLGIHIDVGPIRGYQTDFVITFVSVFRIYCYRT